MNAEALDTFFLNIGFTKVAEKTMKFQKAEESNGSGKSKLLQPGNLQVIIETVKVLNQKLEDLKKP